jgi:hypothetical protein
MRGSTRVTIAVLATAVLGSGGALTAASAPPGPATNVVLVHGAFADGSSWSKVIPLLQAKGLKVTAVGMPLTSFADDVVSTNDRMIAPELEKAVAAQIKAKAPVLPASPRRDAVAPGGGREGDRRGDGGRPQLNLLRAHRADTCRPYLRSRFWPRRCWPDRRPGQGLRP